MNDPVPFQEYDVPGIGTVIDPAGEPGYRVRLADGRVLGFPANSGTPSPANADADLAWAIAHPTPPVPTRQQVYEAQLAAGYLDSATGLKLKTTEYAQGKFTSQVALLNLALSAGACSPTTPQTIWDFAGQPHTLATSDLLALMLRYGVFCTQLFANYAP